MWISWSRLSRDNAHSQNMIQYWLMWYPRRPHIFLLQLPRTRTARPQPLTPHQSAFLQHLQPFSTVFIICSNIYQHVSTFLNLRNQRIPSIFHRFSIIFYRFSIDFSWIFPYGPRHFVEWIPCPPGCHHGLPAAKPGADGAAHGCGRGGWGGPGAGGAALRGPGRWAVPLWVLPKYGEMIGIILVL